MLIGTVFFCAGIAAPFLVMAKGFPIKVVGLSPAIYYVPSILCLWVAGMLFKSALSTTKASVKLSANNAAQLVKELNLVGGAGSMFLASVMLALFGLHAGGFAILGLIMQSAFGRSQDSSLVGVYALSYLSTLAVCFVLAKAVYRSIPNSEEVASHLPDLAETQVRNKRTSAQQMEDAVENYHQSIVVQHIRDLEREAARKRKPDN